MGVTATTLAFIFRCDSAIRVTTRSALVRQIGRRFCTVSGTRTWYQVPVVWSARRRSAVNTYGWCVGYDSNFKLGADLQTYRNRTRAHADFPVSIRTSRYAMVPGRGHGL